MPSGIYPGREEELTTALNTFESSKGTGFKGAADAAERADTPVHRTRIVIVEDHAILREGLRALLELEPDFEVVGEADEVVGALATIERLQPHVCITDLALPGRSGISLIGELCRLKSTVRMLVLTAHNTEEYIRAALNAGAHGYVLKDSGRADLLQAIRVVVKGGQYLCPSVSARVVSGFVNGGEGRSGAVFEHQVMLREKQVLTRIAMGHSNKLIARDLGLSVKTVEKHRSNLMRKLTLHNAAAITLFALRHGFIEAGGQVVQMEKAAI